MRTNYERTVRCFELYLRSGEFEEDVAAGLLPPQDRVLTRAQQHELWARMGGKRPRYVTFRPYPAFHDFGSEEMAAEAAANPVGAVETPPPPQPMSITPAAAAAAAGLPPPTPQAAVGRVVWRKWEGHGWYEGKVTAFTPRHGAISDHTLVYQAGTPHELVERMDVMNPPVPLCWYNPAIRPPPPNGARPLATPLPSLTGQHAPDAVPQPAAGPIMHHQPVVVNGTASAVAAALQPGFVRPVHVAAFAKYHVSNATAASAVAQSTPPKMPRTNAARPLLPPVMRSPAPHMHPVPGPTLPPAANAGGVVAQPVAAAAGSAGAQTRGPSSPQGGGSLSDGLLHAQEAAGAQDSHNTAVAGKFSSPLSVRNATGLENGQMDDKAQGHQS
jgi:hypothetical protein